MPRTIYCPKCRVELTIPEEAGSKRLRCPKCAERFFPDGTKPSKKPTGPAAASGPKKTGSPSASPNKKKVTVPPSSGQHSRPDSSVPKPPTSLPELRDMIDIPLVDDNPFPSSRSNAAADVSALFGDDDSPKPRKRMAEAKREARRCTSCGTVVLQGMSLCENCGLDLDTGRRYEVVEETYDEAPEMAIEAGPPAAVILIGILTLSISLFLLVLTFLQLSAPGPLLLGPVCLFGIFSAIQFLRGRSLKLLIMSLMLAGAVDLVVLVILPIVVAEEEPVAEAPESGDEKVAKPPTAEQTDEAANLEHKVKPLTEKIDNSKMTLGIIVFLAIGGLLLGVSLPGVKEYFEHHHYTYDSQIPIP
jgi:hypothetical protein